jgi:hypothetical protein
LVCGELDGYVEGEPPGQRFVFTWDGNDEMDRVSGGGWISIVPFGIVLVNIYGPLRIVARCGILARGTALGRRVPGR